MLAAYFCGLDIQSWFAVFKLLFMIIAPAILFYHYRKSRINIQFQRLWMIPSIIVAAWASIFFTITPVQVLPYTNIDITSLLVGLLASFLLNAVLEELFYRKWLQTRLEILTGSPWTAIFLVSIVWAVWHITLTGTGDTITNFASVMMYQGVIGIFFGYLWFRYRNIWSVIIAHAFLNLPPQLLLDLAGRIF